MRKSWSSLLLVFIAAAVAGCGRGGGPLKKMTAEDARACLSFEIGEWEGSQESRGGPFGRMNTKWRCVNKWKEEGRSIEGNIEMKVGAIGGLEVSRVMEYDPAKGLIVITRGTLGTTEVFHRSYDPVTREFREKFINPPGGAGLQGKMEYSLNGRLIGVDEIETVAKTYFDGKLVNTVILTGKRKKSQ